MLLDLPLNPTLNQQYVANNGITYTWLGNRWSSEVAVRTGTAAFYYEGSDAAFEYDPYVNDELDGGMADGQPWPGPGPGPLPAGIYVNNVTVHEWWGTTDITYTKASLGIASDVGIIISQPGLCDLAHAHNFCEDPGSASVFYPLTAHPDYVDCIDPALSDVANGEYTQTTYTFHFGNQTVEIRAYAVVDGQTYYSPIVTEFIPYTPCFGAGTQITLADGTKKAIELITYDDDLRVWNFDEGRIDSAKPLWIKTAQSSPVYNLSKYSDGTELRTLQPVRGHRVFNKTQSKFTFISECNIGDVIAKDGVDVTLTSVEHVTKPIVYYNIITDYHMNIYANDILTSTGFNNLYPIQDMRYVKEARTPRKYTGIAKYWVTGLRLAENTTEDVAGMTRHLASLDSLKVTNIDTTTVSIPRYHCKPDPVDPRDHIFSLTAAPLPASVDLRQYASAIEDQGQLGSCTGNAIAGAIELIDRKNNKALDVSRLFIYYQERVYEGTVNYDAGAYIRDGFKAVNQVGAPLEVYWPYIISRFATRPSTQATTDAAKRKVTAYQRCTNFAAVKAALAAGNPVVVGFTVYESFEGTVNNTTGMMPYPNVNTEQVLGGHAVCFVGYNDNLNGGRFIARNSWGTGWGDRGYFYMPYQVIQNTSMSSDFWTLSIVKNP